MSDTQTKDFITLQNFLELLQSLHDASLCFSIHELEGDTGDKVELLGISIDTALQSSKKLLPELFERVGWRMPDDIDEEETRLKYIAAIDAVLGDDFQEVEEQG